MEILILGCGVMGSSFARQFAKQGYSLTVCDQNIKRAKALADEISGTFIEKVDPSGKDFVLLAIKPKDLKAAAKALGPLDGRIVVSILAGTKLADVKALFPKAQVVRCMPNLALEKGEAVMSLVKDKSLSNENIQLLNEILKDMGLVYWTEEGMIDAITALAGSGPAFVIAMIESLVEGAVLCGLRADEAKKLALQTVIGSVALIEDEEGHPGEIRWKIAAPGGTTIAGMKAFEDEGVRAGIINTLLATYQKSKEMGS